MLAGLSSTIRILSRAMLLSPQKYPYFFKKVILGQGPFPAQGFNLASEPLLVLPGYILGGNHNNGNTPSGRVSLQGLQYLKAAYLGHEQVQKDQVWPRLSGQRYSLISSQSFNRPEPLRGQCGFHKLHV